MKEIHQKIEMLAKNAFRKGVFIVFCTFVPFAVFSQENEKLNELFFRLEKIVCNEENEKPKYLSVLISSDSVYVFENGFSNILFRNNIAPLLKSIQFFCQKNEYLSILSSNHKLIDFQTNKLIFENLEKSTQILSVNKTFFKHSFYNLNELISKSWVR